MIHNNMVAWTCLKILAAAGVQYAVCFFAWVLNVIEAVLALQEYEQSHLGYLSYEVQPASDGKPMHEIIDDLASGNEYFAEKFLETFGMMISNG